VISVESLSSINLIIDINIFEFIFLGWEYELKGKFVKIN